MDSPGIPTAPKMYVPLDVPLFPHCRERVVSCDTRGRRPTTDTAVLGSDPSQTAEAHTGHW